MIKKEEEWTFTEHQSNAKGFLNGVLFGITLTLLLIGVGIDFYFLIKY
jgi:hypothetical protein